MVSLFSGKFVRCFFSKLLSRRLVILSNDEKPNSSVYKIPKLITEFIKVFTRPQTRNLLGHSLQFAEMLAGDSVQLHDCMLHISLHPAIFRRPAALAWARGAAVLHTVCSVPVPRDLQIPGLPPDTELSGVLKVYQEIHFWVQHLGSVGPPL